MSEQRAWLYNPLAIESIAESLARKINEAPCGSLPPGQPFQGAGVYMIYYRGDFPVYGALAQANAQACSMPIYIGKATPRGGRIGVMDNDDMGHELYERLKEHAESIAMAVNLDLDDFVCRFLPIEHLFISLAEHTLITMYKPVWNYYGGFGNHDPGSGRYSQNPLHGILCILAARGRPDCKTTCTMRHTGWRSFKSIVQKPSKVL